MGIKRGREPKGISLKNESQEVKRSMEVGREIWETSIPILEPGRFLAKEAMWSLLEEIELDRREGGSSTSRSGR